MSEPKFFALTIGTEILNRRRTDKHFDFVTKALSQKGYKLSGSFIIEDDPAVSRGLQIALEEINYETIIKGTGNSGCESAKTDSPDLIILDLILPEKNGIDICKELRAGKKSSFDTLIASVII